MYGIMVSLVSWVKAHYTPCTFRQKKIQKSTDFLLFLEKNLGFDF
jgi:hypothetical protein